MILRGKGRPDGGYGRTPDGRRRIPGVTTILGSWGDPNGLMRWYGKLGSDAAEVSRVDFLFTSIPNLRISLKSACFFDMDFKRIVCNRIDHIKDIPRLERAGLRIDLNADILTCANTSLCSTSNGTGDGFDHVRTADPLLLFHVF